MIASMLVILGSWFVLALFLVGFGTLLIRLVSGQGGVSKSSSTSAFWIGWAAWLGGLQLIHLGSSLGEVWVLPVLGACGAAGLLWNRADTVVRFKKIANVPTGALIAFAIFAFWISNRGLGPLLSVDSGLYHVTSIKWASEYPLVTGLGNLHGRLAFNSAGFLWLASLDVWPEWFRGWNVGAGLLLLAATLRVAPRVSKQPSANSAFHAVLLLPLVYAAAVMHVSATSPDWIVLMIGVVLASHLYEMFASDVDLDRRAQFLAIGALCAAAIVTKLSFAALGLCAIAVAGLNIVRQRHESVRVLLPGLLLAGLLLVPWTVRSVALSGYPAYPSTIAGQDLSWTVPEERAIAELQWIRSWARARDKTPEEVLGNADWVLPWLGSRLRNSDSVALLVFPLSLMLAAGLIAAFQRTGIQPGPMWVSVPYGVAFLAWFVSAPDPRFLGSTLWVCAAVATALCYGGSGAREENQRGGSPIQLAGFTCAAGFLAFVLYMGSAVGGTFIRPGPMDGRYAVRNVETKAFETQSGLVLQVPRKGDACWEAPLPCTPYPATRLDARSRNGKLAGFQIR